MAEQKVVVDDRGTLRAGDVDGPPEKPLRRNKFAMACAVLASMTSILLGYGKYLLDYMQILSLYYPQLPLESSLCEQTCSIPTNVYVPFHSLCSGRSSPSFEKSVACHVCCLVHSHVQEEFWSDIFFSARLEFSSTVNLIYCWLVGTTLMSFNNYSYDVCLEN